MINRSSIAMFIFSILIISQTPLTDANSSGKHNSSNGCGCHSNSGNQPTISHNFPVSYTAGQTYTVTVSLSSSGSGGFSATIDKGSFANAGTGTSISGSSATHTNSGSTSWSFDWVTPTNSGAGTATLRIAGLAANGNGNTGGDAWRTSSTSITESLPANNPPTVSNLAITPSGDVSTSDSFTLSYTFSDSDGDQEGPTQIRWFVDGNPSTSHNDLKTIPSSSTSIGEVWTVEVTPHDGTETGQMVQCPDSVTITEMDSDNDGVSDSQDAFPNDPTETSDSDSDGVGDNSDAFPNDPSETVDSDGDGVGDNADVFDNDPTETTDSDGDGVGDNGDAFPNDSTETADSDGDGVGDNGDAFPNDSTETTDSDGDGVGNNADAFDNDPTETVDTDGDGVGDNGDAFPNDRLRQLIQTVMESVITQMPSTMTLLKPLILITMA